jgi:sarcosine oxidase subunit alpha
MVRGQAFHCHFGTAAHETQIGVFCAGQTAAKPLEGHIVLNGDKITGNVTSCEYSPTLDQIIGMAYVGIEQSAVDQQFQIRVEKGASVYATVVKAPFYDPNNARQEI